MELQLNAPTKEGQVCKISNPVGDENPDDVYIITDNPALFEGDDTVYVVNLNDLQRNIKSPLLCSQIPVTKSELILIADSLEEYIKSWND